MTETQEAPAAGTKPLCEVRGVTHDFVLPNGKPLRVLENINFAIQPNEVVALLGPSGCGKSTLLRILAGLIVPSKGEVYYRGELLRGMSPGVGFVFQSFALYPWLTVRQNVEVVLRAMHMPNDTLRERIQHCIKTVGLAGFEDVFPRELSGGMKQRCGIARALAVDSEVLFLDEPFSAVDALTAESMRAELIDIWAAAGRNPESILMVSHDIKEVVYMADRIVVLGSNPGRIVKVVENKLPRPRDYRAPEFLKLTDQLHDIITGHEIPDAAPGKAPQAAAIEPIPNVRPNMVVGLLEYLDARGGREDIFHIAADTKSEFGAVIETAEAAEMLDFVDTPKRAVVLTEDGKRFVKAHPNARQALWREHILRLKLFKDVHALLEKQPEHTLDADHVRELIVLHMPHEDYSRMFRDFIGWARFGHLFTYNEHKGRLRLPDAHIEED
ncbi:MAG: nitrate/sulfonate/bicarbonate ABC transporter ATP-binding protein [Planctomycetes bacterium]|nr:nitrate/sulfonate/bicarbonate ABC transporter ATP-binding protein [Planctomycetota bacterium]